MKQQHEERQAEYVGTGISIGAGFGVALGLVLMNILDQPGLFALGIGIGLSIGTAAGLAVGRLKGKNHGGN